MTTNNIIPISNMEDRPERHEYKIMVKLLGLYENDPYNLLSYEEKDDYLYSFAKVFDNVWDEKGLYPNKKERERLQLTFDKIKYPTGRDLKDELRVNRVLVVFGRLNQTINKKTGGRSFSVYRLALMPENIVEIKHPEKGTFTFSIK